MNHADRIELMQHEITQTRNRLSEDRHALERARKEHADLNSRVRTLRARYSVEGNEQDQLDADKLIKQSDAKAKEIAAIEAKIDAHQARIEYANAELSKATEEQRKIECDELRDELLELVQQVVITSEALGESTKALADAEERARNAGAISPSIRLHDPSFIHESFQSGRVMQIPPLAEYVERLRNWKN
jgi:chromosome segregation ATPase